jgi:hypothetical protein
MLKKDKASADSPATDRARRVEADDPLLKPKEAAEHIRSSKSYLDKLRCYGGGPEYVRLGKRKVLYRKSALDSWARQRRFSSTSEYED